MKNKFPKRILAICTAALTAFCTMFGAGVHGASTQDIAVYTGRAVVAVFNYGLTVTVTMDDDNIRSITAEHDTEGYAPTNDMFWNWAVNGNNGMPSPLEQIVQTQSTENIDVVSGATYTCLALVEAVNDALSSIPEPTPTPEPTQEPTPEPEPEPTPEPTYAPGDVDGDGSVTITDSVLAVRNSLGIVELTDAQIAAADVNGDGAVTIADAVRILRMSIGLA